MSIKKASKEIRGGLREAGFGDAEVRAIVSRSGGYCFFCRAQILQGSRRQHEGSPPDGAWEVDHYDGDPKNSAVANLNAVCFWCNRTKVRDLVHGDDFLQSDYLHNARTAQTAFPGLAGSRRDILKALRGEE